MAYQIAWVTWQNEEILVNFNSTMKDELLLLVREEAAFKTDTFLKKKTKTKTKDAESRCCGADALWRIVY